MDFCGSINWPTDAIFCMSSDQSTNSAVIPESLSHFLRRLLILQKSKRCRPAQCLQRLALALSPEDIGHQSYRHWGGVHGKDCLQAFFHFGIWYFSQMLASSQYGEVLSEWSF